MTTNKNYLLLFIFSALTFGCAHEDIETSSDQTQSIATVPASEVEDLLYLEQSIQNKGIQRIEIDPSNR